MSDLNENLKSIVDRAYGGRLREFYDRPICEIPMDPEKIRAFNKKYCGIDYKPVDVSVTDEFVDTIYFPIPASR